MKIIRERRFHAEVSTHSLNDIMFFLLLFFLIVSTVANPNVIKILLPKSTTKADQVKPHRVDLTVTAEKQYFINGQPVSYGALESTLLAEAQKHPEMNVVVSLPYNLKVQDLVDVMQIGAKNQFKMVLATTKKE